MVANDFLTRNFGPCKSPRAAIGWLYCSSTDRMVSSNSFFCSCEPCEKLRRNTSAPARNNFSIVSRSDEAGPRVASCLVDLRHRWAILGAEATLFLLVAPNAPLVAPSNSPAEVDDSTTALMVEARLEGLCCRRELGTKPSADLMTDGPITRTARAAHVLETTPKGLISGKNNECRKSITKSEIEGQDIEWPLRKSTFRSRSWLASCVYQVRVACGRFAFGCWCLVFGGTHGCNPDLPLGTLHFCPCPPFPPPHASRPAAHRQPASRRHR